MRIPAFFLRVMAASAMFATAAMAQDAPAQEQPSGADLRVELNALQPSERGCRFTFVVTNGLEAELSSAAFEMVLFDTDGMVSRITVVDFKDLPNGKTKVRQFDFSGVDCTKLGRILINDATDCTGTGVEAGACIRQLKTETRTDIEFGV